MDIRDETAADIAAISALVERAFAGQQHSDGTEQFVVPALREAGALSVSLVACGEAVG
jgi:putative acetyltransferase